MCLARSRVYEKIASYLRSVIICGPIVYCRIVEITRNTLLIIESFYKNLQKTVKYDFLFVVTLHFVTLSCKIERTFVSLQIVVIFLLQWRFARVAIAAPKSTCYGRAIIIFVIPALLRLAIRKLRDCHVCGTYGSGGVHHSLLPWGAETSLVFTCIKSECPGHIRRGDLRVSNDWFITF